MKKFVIALLLASPLAFAEPAFVINEDGGCTGFVPNDVTETGLPPLAILRGSTHAVVNSGGNTKLTCKFDHAVDLAHATAGRGFGCGTPTGGTTDSLMIATPGGTATMSCQIKKPKPVK